MKKILIALSLILSSCKSYKAMVNETLTVKADTIVCFKNHKMDIIPVKINNTTYDLLFDTGSMVTMISSPTFKVEEKNIVGKQNVIGFNKEIRTRTTTFVADSMTTSIFNAKNKIIYLSPSAPTSCGSNAYSDGLLGRIVPPEEYVTELNYKEGYIRFLKTPDYTGYEALSGKFSNYHSNFEVELEVNGHKEFFLFDTGNKTITTLNKKVFTNMGDSVYNIRLLSSGLNGIPFPFLVDIYNTTFKMGNLEFDFPAGLDQTTDRSVLGLNFIQKFNWIIDQKNKRVYFKPLDSEKLLSKKHLKKPADLALAHVFNQKLLVYYLNFNSPKYNLGDEIIKVDDEKVTAENICDLATKLNNKSDWSIFKIETVPAKSN